MYDGISEKDVATSVLITARTLVEEEPNYTFVTARILLDDLRAEALAFLAFRHAARRPATSAPRSRRCATFIRSR